MRIEITQKGDLNLWEYTLIDNDGLVAAISDGRYISQELCEKAAQKALDAFSDVVANGNVIINDLTVEQS